MRTTCGLGSPKVIQTQAHTMPRRILCVQSLKNGRIMYENIQQWLPNTALFWTNHWTEWRKLGTITRKRFPAVWDRVEEDHSEALHFMHNAQDQYVVMEPQYLYQGCAGIPEPAGRVFVGYAFNGSSRVRIIITVTNVTGILTFTRGVFNKWLTKSFRFSTQPTDSHYCYEHKKIAISINFN